MKNLRKKIKNIWFIRVLIVSYRAVKVQYGFFQKVSFVRSFFKDLKVYKKMGIGNFKLYDDNLKPCIYDKTTNTPVGPVYFYQDAWCAGKVFKAKPSHHYDIASEAGMVGIISQFVPTTMIDIRPIDLRMPGLHFEKGSILALPFKDNSIESLSTICVVEHIGLGRYGDELDTMGSEKSIKELIRVLKPGGNLYITVPVDVENKIYFNAHRVFTPEYILKLFSELKLIEEKYIYARDLYEKYDPKLGFGTGLYHFQK